MATAPKTVEIELIRERETKKMVRFEEKVDPRAKDEEGVCKKFYMTKTALEGLGNPDILHMRIEAGDTGE